MVEFYFFCLHVKFFFFFKYDVLNKGGVKVGVKLHFLMIVLWTEHQPSRNSPLRLQQVGRYYFRESQMEREGLRFC